MKEDWDDLFHTTCKEAASQSNTMNGSYLLKEYFDEEGKPVAQYYPDEKGILQNRRIYRYRYDTQHRVTQVIQLVEGKHGEGVCFAVEKYIYNDQRLEKSLHYWNIHSSQSGNLSLHTMHQYIYQEGQIAGDEVFLASGERCCFRKFSASLRDIVYPRIPGFSWEFNYFEGEIINPFRTDFSWVLYGVDEDSLCITVKEKRLTPLLFSDMVLHLHQAYKQSWLIVDAFGCTESSKEDSEAVTRLMWEYEKNMGIQINFG